MDVYLSTVWGKKKLLCRRNNWDIEEIFFFLWGDSSPSALVLHWLGCGVRWSRGHIEKDSMGRGRPRCRPTMLLNRWAGILWIDWNRPALLHPSTNALSLQPALLSWNPPQRCPPTQTTAARHPDTERGQQI